MEKPVVFAALLFCCGLSIAVSGAVLVGQSQAVPAQLTFEVVTIKPTVGAGGASFRCHATDSGMPAGSTPALGRCTVIGNTLRMLIATSYGINIANVKGGPDWADSVLFDVEAKAEDPAKTTRPMFGLMLQSLLAERFKLAFHRESIESSGYALVVAKGGSKLKQSESDDARVGISGGNSGPITSRHWFIDRLAIMLSNRLSEPVVDQTGLTGPYDFTLSWGDDGVGGFGGQRGGPSIFTAIQEQLGLRLDAKKVSVDAIVIDRAERPIFNW